MSDLQFHFERLLTFTNQPDFFEKPTLEPYFFFTRLVNYQEQPVKIQSELLIRFNDFEKDFDDLMNQGHSWINLSLVGYLGEILLVEVDFPNYENNCPKEKISVNLSLHQYLNFDASSNFQLV